MPNTHEPAAVRPHQPSDPASAAPRPARIALVGHCGPDSWMLKGVVARAFPGAEVAMVNDTASAQAHAEKADLLLVNRTLDGDFFAGSGLDLIRVLLSVAKRHAALMLVSNHADAQAQAEGLGAAPGFGKSKAGSPEAAQRMRAAVAHAATRP
ncbi:MAG: hypothetical protein AABZ53_09405 [Planctomycetota bacterium]